MIDGILSLYHITIEEFKLYNTHLTNYRNLLPGTKLKIPFLSLENEQILKKTESFISDYYPVIEELSETEMKNEVKEVFLEKEVESEVKEVEKIVEQSKSEIKPEIKPEVKPQVIKVYPYPGIMPIYSRYSGHINPMNRIKDDKN